MNQKLKWIKVEGRYETQCSNFEIEKNGDSDFELFKNINGKLVLQDFTFTKLSYAKTYAQDIVDKAVNHGGARTGTGKKTPNGKKIAFSVYVLPEIKEAILAKAAAEGCSPGDILARDYGPQ